MSRGAVANKRKRKPKKKIKDDPTIKLYKAVAAYVKSKGGTVIVAGGIQIIQWPGELKYHYTVGIKVTGHLPKFAGVEP